MQVRNRGTIGGNICTNDPTNHLPPLLAALGAEMTIHGAGGDRTVTAQDFFLGVYMTAVGAGELLTKIRIPAGRADGFAAVTLGVEGTCIVSAAASINGSREDRARLRRRRAGRARAGVGGRGSRASPRSPPRASTPPSDVHASSEYRTHLAEVLAVRAVAQAAKNRS